MDDLMYYSGSVGFKFNPTDEELVGYYLFYRVNQNPLANQFIIQDCDVYGEKEPWQIWESLGGATCNDDGFLYVFSLLKKEKGSDGGCDYNWNVGSSGGTWHGVGRGKSLRSGEISWTQKTFSYWNEKNKAEYGCWLMQEYSLDYLGNNDNKIVLCRIKNNHKKRKSAESDEEDGIVGDDQREMGFKRSKVDAVPAPEKIKEKVEDSLFNDVAIVKSVTIPLAY